jgi:hypothetical protein
LIDYNQSVKSESDIDMVKLILTRQELYDIVWDKPIKYITSELDISPGSISEACKKLNIPKPESGYWSKLKSKPYFIKPALPPISSTVPINFDFTLYIQDKKIRSDLEILLSGLDIEYSKPLHPLIRKSKKAYKQASLDKRNRLVPNKEEHVDFKVSNSAYTKANTIMSTLFYMFKELGWAINLKTTEHTSMEVSVNGVDISFFFKEKVIQEPYKMTASEQRKVDRGEWVYTERYSFIPTGEFHIILGNSVSESRKAVVNSDNYTNIKVILIKFCSSLIPTARRMMVERDRRDEWHRQYELDQKIAREIREEKERLLAKQQQLESDTGKWHQAERMREFIKAKVEKANSQEVNDWGKWAYRYADSIDPLNQPK